MPNPPPSSTAIITRIVSQLVTRVKSGSSVFFLKAQCITPSLSEGVSGVIGVNGDGEETALTGKGVSTGAGDLDTLGVLCVTNFCQVARRSVSSSNSASSNHSFKRPCAMLSSCETAASGGLAPPVLATCDRSIRCVSPGSCIVIVYNVVDLSKVGR